MYVAFSGGKDSAALLDLVIEQKPDTEARMLLWPESEVMADYDRVISAWRDRGVRVSVLRLSRNSLDESVSDRWQSLAQMAPAGGVFVGLRADESRHRAIALARHGVVHRYVSGPLAGLVRAAPLAAWQTADVGAWISTRDLPVLDTYDVLGISARTSSRIPRGQARDQAMSQMAVARPWATTALRHIYPDDMI